MKVKCEHCGSFIPDTAEKCPNCGATNAAMLRSANGVPKTIEELQQFCADKHMPLEKMRFFIGKDYRGARAFGIYRAEDGTVVVYKNKADGSRAIRYQGTDEAYAVNELYQKLKSEVTQRKAAAPGKPPQRKRMTATGIIMLIVLAAAIALFVIGLRTPDRGYYRYGDDLYYNDLSSWYIYDTMLSDWQPTEASTELNDHYSDYYDGRTYNGSSTESSFADSEYAEKNEQSSYSDDWDASDWSYDYDSWDSGGTDWSSDW